MDATFYSRSPLSPEEAAENDRVLGRLTAATRALADAQLRTTVDLAEVAEVTKAVEELTERLLVSARTGAFGVEVGQDGEIRNHGNAVMGLRNPMAFLHDIQHDPSGRAWVSFHCGPLYEGPPGMVHGGVSALLLDQMLGHACGAGGSPGMTGRLELTYRRPTPLGDLSAEAWIERVEGIKTIAKGHIKDAEGRVTVEAEGLFILPRWAREGAAKESWPARPSTFE